MAPVAEVAVPPISATTEVALHIRGTGELKVSIEELSVSRRRPLSKVSSG